MESGQMDGMDLKKVLSITAGGEHGRVHAKYQTALKNA